MANSNPPDALANIAKADSESRLQYLVKESRKQQQLWILIDDDGCVMLNSEAEDCVPGWPNQEFAAAWAAGDWQHCKPESISLAKWKSRWTDGLSDDELYVAVFPNDQEEGLILSPYEFEELLNKGR